MCLHDALGDEQPEPSAVALTDLPEPLEDRLQMVTRDACTRVRD
jgi:hypothetical protein